MAENTEAEKKTGLSATFMRHYRKSTKIWFIAACITVIFGIMLPSGLMGMICLLMAKGFLDIAEEAHA
jgi:putative effector of murein hydrolase LrgA (UPF0299 family)